MPDVCNLVETVHVLTVMEPIAPNVFVLCSSAKLLKRGCFCNEKQLVSKVAKESRAVKRTGGSERVYVGSPRLSLRNSLR